MRAAAANGNANIEIISDAPLAPAVTRMENPARLIIDLPNAQLAKNAQKVNFRSDQVSGIRADQFKRNPPAVRIVADLSRSVSYTWDASGNLLTVHLRNADSDAQRVAAAANAHGSSILLAGNRVAPGSSITAGLDTAVMRLGRGGEVKVCPGTTISVTPSQSGQSLMLGMNSGSLETHYTLESGLDSIMTPDFRILLRGPGEYHFAISADAHGNTCIQALPGNTAAAVVSELLGDGTYEVKPTQQIAFRTGRLSALDPSPPLSCGCPPPLVPVLRASATQIAAPLPPKPNDPHVEVEAPLVFRAGDPPPSAPTQEARLLPVRVVNPAATLETTVLPPAKRRSMLGKIKSFLASIFG